jgi:hypothetical protein
VPWRDHRGRDAPPPSARARRLLGAATVVPFRSLRRFQNPERIVPCSVHDVRDPKVEIGEDSQNRAARALGVVRRLPAVRQCCRLAGDLTTKDVPDMRGGKRRQLLRRVTKVDHPVELGCALARMPRQAQDTAMVKRQTEAPTKPESIGAEVEISASERETLLRNGNGVA